MKLDALLRAHAFMNVERPPELWEADTDDVAFVPLLGEMIAAGLTGGADLAALTLNASNVVVPDDDHEGHIGPAPGDYVAVSVGGRTNLGPDSRWTGDARLESGLLARVHERLVTARVRFAYIRRVPPSNGSITVLLRRVHR